MDMESTQGHNDDGVDGDEDDDEDDDDEYDMDNDDENDDDEMMIMTTTMMRTGDDDVGTSDRRFHEGSIGRRALRRPAEPSASHRIFLRVRVAGIQKGRANRRPRFWDPVYPIGH